MLPAPRRNSDISNIALDVSFEAEYSSSWAQNIVVVMLVSELFLR